MADGPSDVLERFRLQAELSQGELWMRYFELGGMSTALEVEAFVFGALEPSPHDHDVLAHALNERFVELGGNHPVPYADSVEEEHAVVNEPVGDRRPGAQERRRGRRRHSGNSDGS
ncbi:MAG: hypothetical protein ACYCXY_06620 [Acidimicrobiales bacterium]